MEVRKGEVLRPRPFHCLLPFPRKAPYQGLPKNRSACPSPVPFPPLSRHGVCVLRGRHFSNGKAKLKWDGGAHVGSQKFGNAFPSSFPFPFEKCLPRPPPRPAGGLHKVPTGRQDVSPSTALAGRGLDRLTNPSQRFLRGMAKSKRFLRTCVGFPIRVDRSQGTRRRIGIGFGSRALS